jgi:hypothetical protein
MNQLVVPANTLNAGFVDISYPVPAAGGGFDPTTVSLIVVEVEAPMGSTGPWQTPATLVYFDSVTSSNGVVNHQFATNPIPDPFQQSGARPLTGSAASWLATFP